MKRRSRMWRWLVVQRDKPPMPVHAEVVTGRLTKRAAEQEAKMLRATHAAHGTINEVEITVKRAT